MLVANYKSKKELRESVGKRLRFIETSMFAPEYQGTGKFAVVGPSAYNRKWYAEVKMENDLIKSVK
jgi:hypothetical protein